MRAAVEISLYPLDASYIERILAFIKRLNTHAGLVVLTNTMSTQVFGELGEVMTILTQEIEAAAQIGPRLIFVMKVIPGLSPP
jgi:uncharacterized protein YqgV (UPF0045/DUF77 family)